MTFNDMVKTLAKDDDYLSYCHSESMRDNLKSSFLVNLDDTSSVSLGSMVFNNSYKEIYETYLSQFKNKNINGML